MQSPYRFNDYLSRTMFVLALMFLAQGVFADDAADVNQLLKTKQYDLATQKVEAVLAQKPRDPQMRFFLGVIYSEQGKVNEAIAEFVHLTQDFPELPEPYNNLAVLYASQGEYEKARAALELAIRTHPSFATAHENLGDVYIKLASLSYEKAVQLNPASASAQGKLKLARELLTNVPAIPKKQGTTPKAGDALSDSNKHSTSAPQ